MPFRSWLFGALLVATAHCAGQEAAPPPPPTPDAPGPDGEAGVPDSGPAAVDAGAPDSGPTGDGGSAAHECATPGADWLFCSGFEEGNFSIWDDYDGNPPPYNTLLEDPGPFNTPGNHVMRLFVPPGRGDADVVKVFTPQDHAFARWYMYWEPGYDFSAHNHGSGLNAGNRNYLGESGNRPNGSDWFGSWVEPNTTNFKMEAYTYYAGMYQDCADPNGMCWGDGFPCMYDTGQVYCTKPADRPQVDAPALQTGKWYCVEMEWEAGTPTPSASGADGKLDWWLDGQEMGPWPNLWLRTTPNVQVDVLWLSTFFHGAHADAGVRFDDVVVSTSRIGCP